MAHQIIDIDGVPRFLGNNPQPQGLLRAWPVYGETAEEPLIPRSEWRDLIDAQPGGASMDDPFLPPVADQNGYGMCNASATATALEAARLMMGLPYVQLSGGDLYGRINGGVDRGSFLEDGLAESMKNGIAPVSAVPYLNWQTSPPGVDKVRLGFVVLEASLCPTFDHVMSAVLRGRKLISGVPWYANYKPDQTGWLPRGSGGSGGHAIFGYKGTYRNRTEYGIWHQNSWSPRWGLNGRFVLHEGGYAGQVGGWWAIRAVSYSDKETLPAPK